MADLDAAAAERVHYATDPRIRQLAEARWRLTTGSTRDQWLALGKDNPEALIREARDWVRAAVAAGILPPPERNTDMGTMSQTPSPPLLVGQQLKRRREELDLTQGTLANLVDVTVTSVSSAENERSTISRGKRPAWERALNLIPGTISRAYRDGTPIEPADNPADMKASRPDLTPAAPSDPGSST
jgi:DNA-binding XRE family transcriptional regulator